MRHYQAIKVISVFLVLVFCGVMQAQDAPTAIAGLQDAAGTSLGTVTFTDTPEGLQVTIAAMGLPPGKHGLHIHSEGSCEASTDDDAGMEVMHGAAGGHFDPATTENHGGPDVDSATGHAGDLPNLEVLEDGSAAVTFTTTKLTVAEGETSLANRTIMIHANEDNYGNEPKNGGSGDRIACGVIALQ
jgi:superoxide dismutase, Cu-Zn family